MVEKVESLPTLSTRARVGEKDKRSLHLFHLCTLALGDKDEIEERPARHGGALPGGGS